MSMNDAILAVAQAQQQGDAIPVDVPPMTQTAPDMGKPPETGGLAGASLPGLAAVHRHVRARAFRNHVP